MLDRSEMRFVLPGFLLTSDGENLSTQSASITVHFQDKGASWWSNVDIGCDSVYYT